MESNVEKQAGQNAVEWSEAAVAGEEFEVIANLCDKRVATYGLLARVYRTEVDQVLIDELKQMRFPAHSDNESMDEGYRLIVGYLSSLWENSLFELSVDYVRAFIGHGVNGHAAAYPYESAYRSEKHLLMQDARDEVLAVYRASGFDTGKDWKEGEDHAAAELEFMQALAARAAEQARDHDEEALLSTLRTQANFMDDHILLWMPTFAHEVTEFAQTDFYRGFADLTAGYLQEDRSLLKGLLED